MVLLGVGFELWDTWSASLGYTRPKGMGSRAKLTEYSTVFGDTGGDLWFHIKSDSQEDAGRMLEVIETRVRRLIDADKSMVVPAEKRHKGKVLGGRFTDGLENPADIEDLSARIVVGDEDPTHQGAAFLLTQKFVHDWSKLDAMSEQQKQNMIGRDQRDRILTIEDESSHIKRVRQLGDERVNARLLRQALPYGRRSDNTRLREARASAKRSAAGWPVWSRCIGSDEFGSRPRTPSPAISTKPDALTDQFAPRRSK